MTADSHGQGELFGQRAKRSRMADPGGRGEPTKAPTPGRRPRRGAEFVADPITAAAAETRRQLSERLEALALEVGETAGPNGFALYHVRNYAVAAGVLTGEEGKVNPRELSWLGALLPGMARRGLVEKLTVAGRPQYDTSTVDGAHGNKNLLWRLTPEGRATRDAAKVRHREVWDPPAD